ncbi:ABC transporter permease [Synechococcus sp. KORDI-52]|uniref:ABC transporter permease n=1 Tax=Synechococcus sp. KORDI-52 TaxID=585425 RepID=UPI0004E07501|nr:ABC-2 family transporter protein [Synechococcus sp. KORDI-52]AII48154.1 ABC transporter permease [Synechococcus sp. KORDI-52]
MRRYWRTLCRFWGTAVAVQLEYQVNVLIELLAVVMSLSGSLFLLSLFYGSNQTLGGWSWAQALMVQGLYTVFDGMASTWLRPNLGAIVTHVREGTLDFVLLKPIDSQFWLSLRTLSPAGLPEICLGLGLLLWGSRQAAVEFSLSSVFIVLVMLLAGGLILYSLWFLIAATSIWFVKTWNATEVLRTLLSSGRYPLTAYPPTLRLVFTVVLPVAFLTTVPAQVLLGEAAVPMVLTGLGLAVMFFAAARTFWLFALRSYTSASS